jgi:hypothetical protein
MKNKDGSTSWEAERVADDEDIIPIVPAIPLSQKTHANSNRSFDDNHMPVIALPDTSIVSSHHLYTHIVTPDYEESQAHDGSIPSQNTPHRDLQQEWRDCRRQAKNEWNQLKKSLKREAKIHKQILKQQHGALKQQWKCQKRALKEASCGCGRSVTDEARLWRSVAGQESRALRDSFHKLQRERMASVRETKQEILGLGRSFGNLWR